MSIKIKFKILVGIVLLVFVVLSVTYLFVFGNKNKANNKINDENLSLEAIVNKNSSLALNTRDQAERRVHTRLLASITKIHENIMNSFGAFSADTVLVTDPLYAVNFTGKGTDGFDLFYREAFKNRTHVKIYVIQEPIDKKKFNIELGTLSGVVQFLSAQDYLLIKNAETLLVSPLLEVFAPKQYQAIKKIRESAFRPFTKIIYDEDVSSESYLSLNYENAMRDLGAFGAQLARSKSAISPHIALILTSNDINSILKRVTQFLWSVYQVDKNITISYHWISQNINTSIDKVINSLALQTVIYVDAGSEGYAAVSNFIEERQSSPVMWKSRFLLFSYFNLEQLGYNIPVAGKVNVDQDFIFQKKHKINAKFYRIIDD